MRVGCLWILCLVLGILVVFMPSAHGETYLSTLEFELDEAEQKQFGSRSNYIDNTGIVVDPDDNIMFVGQLYDSLVMAKWDQFGNLISKLPATSKSRLDSDYCFQYGGMVSSGADLYLGLFKSYGGYLSSHKYNILNQTLTEFKVTPSVSSAHMALDSNDSLWMLHWRDRKSTLSKYDSNFEEEMSAELEQQDSFAVYSFTISPMNKFLFLVQVQRTWYVMKYDMLGMLQAKYDATNAMKSASPPYSFSLHVDKDGNFYVIDRSFNPDNGTLGVYKPDPGGKLQALWTKKGLYLAPTLATDSKGNLYILHKKNEKWKIRRYSPASIAAEFKVSKPETVTIKAPTRKPGWLAFNGAQITAYIAKAFKLPIDYGILVSDVYEGSPLKDKITPGSRKVSIGGTTYTLGGDIITDVEGTKVESMRDISVIFRTAKKYAGDSVDVTFIKNGQTNKQTITVHLMEQPR